jgi:hypothetical protein
LGKLRETLETPRRRWKIILKLTFNEWYVAWTDLAEDWDR